MASKPPLRPALPGRPKVEPPPAEALDRLWATIRTMEGMNQWLAPSKQFRLVGSQVAVHRLVLRKTRKQCSNAPDGDSVGDAAAPGRFRRQTVISAPPRCRRMSIAPRNEEVMAKRGWGKAKRRPTKRRDSGPRPRPVPAPKPAAVLRPPDRAPMSPTPTPPFIAPPAPARAAGAATAIPAAAKARLVDPLLRLDRADEHFADLQAEIGAYLGARPYRLVARREASGEYVFRAFIDREPPDRLKVLVGDVCHSLRTALNQLAYVLATPKGAGEPPTPLEFPIFKDAADYSAMDPKSPTRPARRGGLYKVRGIEPAAQAVIESLQPYHASDPEQHELWLIHELDVVDKHQKGLVTGTILQGASMGINEMHGGDLLIHHVGGGVRSGPFQNGAEVARFSYTGGSGPMRMNINPTFAVAFNPKGPGRGAPVLECLTRLRNYVRNTVFPQLEGFV